MPLSLAIVAVTVSTSASASFILWYIAACTAIGIGVMNLFACWFTSFVNGVIRTHFSCHWSWSPVKDFRNTKGSAQ
jgi:hypothetical protein